MDTNKLTPILNKESILHTASARDLRDNPQNVLELYYAYAQTHIPLGDTIKQLKDLERVVVENKHCAVGTIVGPYGYGKTSTAVYLWSELRERHILAIPPFLWVNLSELMDAVYYWLCFEFSQGPRAFSEPLEQLYEQHQQSSKAEMFEKIGTELAQELLDQGRLNLSIRPNDVIAFFSGASKICEQAGYKGMIIFTDELQQTLAQYKPSRDEFFADLFKIINDMLVLEGRWALVISMNDDTEATISRQRSDILARMQRSALYFRVKDVYNRREYPTELWSAYEKRFGFDGEEVISSSTLDSIGQIAAREDLGAGPRMVTQALALAIKSYLITGQAYTPMQFVDHFLDGSVTFGQLGKFASATKKALENDQVKNSEENQMVIKLLAAYPMGCSEKTLEAFGCLNSFQTFPPLARKELILLLSGGPTLRGLAEDNRINENVVQRLTAEFASRFNPGRSYAPRVVEGFFSYVIMPQVFPVSAGWKSDNSKEVDLNGIKYQAKVFRGNLDSSYPERTIAVLASAVANSSAPTWKKHFDQADIELRFELNYNLPPTEPSRLIVAPEQPDIAVFQFNTMALRPSDVRIIPNVLFEYYGQERWNPFLCLSLIDYLSKNQGDSLEEQKQVSPFISSLRQFALLILLGDQLETVSPEFASRMVGTDRIKDLLKKQCQSLYPKYRTLITNPKWQENIQQYEFALQKLIAQNELSIARGRRPYVATKDEVAATFAIPGKRLGNIDPLLENLKSLIVKEDFSGRSASSEVTLRFRLHPLEEDLLNQLDSSEEKAKRDGLEIPRLPAELFLRYARKEGYTDLEVGAILALLKKRRFIDLDQRNNLVRTIDAVDDLRDAVQSQLHRLEEQVRLLANALPDFDSSLYPLKKLQTRLEEAKERDELETINMEARQSTSRLNSFAAHRAENLKEKLREEREDLHRRIKQGVPPWLSNTFDSSPLQDLLEKQRRDLAFEYQASLEEIRQLYETSQSAAYSRYDSLVEEVIATYEALIDLSKQSQKLITRIKSYQDRQEDFDAWRKVSSTAEETDREALNAQQVYEHGEFKTEADHLWAALHTRFASQSLSFLSGHRSVGKDVEELRQRILFWLNGRRNDFEEQCLTYQQLLAAAHIRAELKVPFDRERPSASQEALMSQVKDYLERYFGELSSRLKVSLRTIRYCIQVQGFELTNSESHAAKALESASELKKQITSEVIGSPQNLKAQVIKPLVDLTEEEKRLAAEIQRATQQRPAEGNELKLMELFQSGYSSQEIDLREVIINLIDQGKGIVYLDDLMRDLEALFQKNLIDIRIRVSRG